MLLESFDARVAKSDVGVASIHSTLIMSNTVYVIYSSTTYYTICHEARESFREVLELWNNTENILFELRQRMKRI